MFPSQVPKQGSQEGVPWKRFPRTVCQESKVPRNRLPSMVPRKRFPVKVPGSRFCKTGRESQEQVSKQARFQARFPSKFPKQGPQARLPSKLSKQVSQSSERLPETDCQARFQKSARSCGAKHISKSKVLKTEGAGPLLEVEMSKKWIPLWREAPFEVQSVKKRVRTTFGRSDVVLRGRRKGLCTLSKVSKP